MKNRTNKRISCLVLAIIASLAFFQTSITAQVDEPERTPEGVWKVRILPRNCTTGDPIPAGNNDALFTFHKDGTMSVWAQNNTITLTRSPSHGLWKREKGWNEYSYKFIHLRYNLTTGAHIGSQVASATLLLGDSGDEFTTDSQVTIFDVNGNQVGNVSCSNSVGIRFVLEP